MPLVHKLALAAVAGISTYAAVGGWAVITVVNPPEFLAAGSVYELEYVVRQHGVTLLSGLDGSIVMQTGGSSAGGEAVTTRSRAAAAGHYRATIRVPQTDRLSLRINSGFSGGGWGDLSLMSVPVIRGNGARPSPSPVERGHVLFVAKGCGTCHLNGDVPEFAEMNRTTKVAPELTGRRLDSAYVRQRLTNPSSLPRLGDSPVRMPALELSPPEVTALVAFLTRSTDRASRQ
jgi:hypothetical protein